MIGLPLVTLLADAVVKPRFLENGGRAGKVDLLTLLERRHVRIGTIHGHEVAVGLGRADEDSYLDVLRKRRSTALVISCFSQSADPNKASEGSTAILGPLTQAVLRRISAAAPAASRKVLDALETSRGYRVGDVRNVNLAVAPRDRHAFPVDQLFVVLLAHGRGAQQPFGDIFPALLRQATAGGVDTLVVPIIGYNWENDHNYPLGDFLRELLSSLATAAQPAHIEIELYSEWPTPVLEEAVAELNAAADQLPQPVRQRFLHRQEVRLLYVLLALCLLASAFAAPLTLKNTILIVFAYTGVYLGASKTIDFFASDLPLLWRTVGSLVVYAVLAGLFPVIVLWRVEDIFKTGPGPKP